METTLKAGNIRNQQILGYQSQQTRDTCVEKSAEGTEKNKRWIPESWRVLNLGHRGTIKVRAES